MRPMTRYQIAAQEAEQRFEARIAPARKADDVHYLTALSMAGHVLSMLHKLEIESVGKSKIIRLICRDGVRIGEDSNE